MSNRFKIRRGSKTPSSSDLELYELGYAIDENQLYIKREIEGNEQIKALGGRTLIKYSLVVDSNREKYEIGTSGEPLPVDSNSVVLIDLDYKELDKILDTETQGHIIRIYRSFDFVDNGIENGIVSLKVNGSRPTANDINSILGAFDDVNTSPKTSRIPLKIVIIN